MRRRLLNGFTPWGGFIWVAMCSGRLLVKISLPAGKPVWKNSKNRTAPRCSGMSHGHWR
jgi:hypothetical protein